VRALLEWLELQPAMMGSGLQGATKKRFRGALLLPALLLAVGLAAQARAQAHATPATPPSVAAPAAPASPTAESPPPGTAASTTPTLELEPATEVPPPPPAYQSSTAVPAGQAGCFPACRSGFLCHEQQCIYACNPVCAPGQQCSDAGECVGTATMPPGANESASHRSARRHDGFMLRFSLGVGGGVVREHVSGDTTNVIGTSGRTAKYSGVTLGPTLDIGGALDENLVLHGRLSLLALPSPKLTDDGQDAGTAKDLIVNTTVLGPALSYYFMPLNVFATAAIALCTVRFDYKEGSGGVSRSSGTGLSLQLDGGKEWWVGDSLGLGAAVRLEYSSIARHDDNAGWTREYSLLGASAMFSATYQ
jgi:hypothetical protein